MKEERLVDGYYQSNIKTSRNEDSVYAMKYASQQILIDKLEEENKSLQSQLKAKEEAEKEFIKLLEYKWNESQDIWFIKLLNKYKEITSKQAKENDEILSKGENK